MHAIISKICLRSREASVHRSPRTDSRHTWRRDQATRCNGASGHRCRATMYRGQVLGRIQLSRGCWTRSSGRHQVSSRNRPRKLQHRIRLLPQHHNHFIRESDKGDTPFSTPSASDRVDDQSTSGSQPLMSSSTATSSDTEIVEQEAEGRKTRESGPNEARLVLSKPQASSSKPKISAEDMLDADCRFALSLSQESSPPRAGVGSDGSKKAWTSLRAPIQPTKHTNPDGLGLTSWVTNH
ncbi:hypothetical protein FB451DRAFT_58785 [Mycena latifolia]|nr:hypothetical protein FB451DRAFT_58785 [Mycena latifolia]